jgi:hypothetical protein
VSQAQVTLPFDSPRRSLEHVFHQKSLPQIESRVVTAFHVCREV